MNRKYLFNKKTGILFISFINIFVSLLVTSCEKKIDWNLDIQEQDFIIVEGMITSEKKAHQVKISKPVKNLNDPAVGVSGAIVSINDSIILTETTSGSGVYQTASSVSGSPENEYKLKIISGGKTYTAVALMKPCNSLSPLRYSKIGGTNNYKIDWIAGAYNYEKAFMYEITLDWSSSDSCLQGNPCFTLMYYYTLTTIDVNQIFSPETERIIFPAGTIITEKKYSISAEHENFIRCLLIETKWRGGLFDSSPANIPTNLTGGAKGFFSACDVIQTIIVVN
ncbi:MAG: hypothetical protein A2275_11925 [Bacteroidetes bacterium RIFOXYA12_FULL_35_11]|nr:MAG: hypothetical protein A2X01_21085 [Bacteroidetes bacterium GWF2_35_48]OFY81562.1 MAG: hypothetical protein A2275_11925 [Bacteroidetes bacterium RIFOXYA12_FULL_35_11]OFY94414.1 MAG: hypothetical protein A2491_00370 [Bacteroidetes bacterium RIFOXYC12_FULL_35_7]OFY96260.1 MAG: hypothetical protein A2309_05890 [Bacteroidetes bacterium RIFOXYB2_FULL_35_7]